MREANELNIAPVKCIDKLKPTTTTTTTTTTAFGTDVTFEHANDNVIDNYKLQSTVKEAKS